MKSLKDMIRDARLHANDHAYDSQREFDDADRLSALSDDVKRIDGRIDEIQPVLNFHGATNEEQDAAIDVLTDAFTETRKVIMNLAERIVKDEERIGIDEESMTDLADDTTILGMITEQQNDFEDLDAQIDVIRDPATDNPMIERINELRSEIHLAQMSFDAKLDAYERRFNESIDAIQTQINRDPER